MELLKTLTETPSISGREEQIREVIRRHAEPLVDELRVDSLGSLIGIRRPRPRKEGGGDPVRVLLAAHMDQIGFVVSHVSDKGFARVAAIGGFDTRNLFARRVRVTTTQGELPAVMNPAGKPVHVADPEERKKVPEIHELFLDFGLPAEKVKERIRVGDMVTIDEPFRRLGDAVVAQALDNRIGCWVLLRALERLEHHDCEIHAVWTVQEEVGLRGAGPATYGVRPDVGVALDTTLCCDTPGVPEEQWINQMGKGVAIKVLDGSMISDPRLVDSLEEVAKARSITYQRSLLTRGGTDSGAIQRTAAGVRVVTLACPVRYIHTVTETASVADIEAYRDLVAGWLEELTPERVAIR